MKLPASILLNRLNWGYKYIIDYSYSVTMSVYTATGVTYDIYKQ